MGSFEDFKQVPIEEGTTFKQVAREVAEENYNAGVAEGRRLERYAIKQWSWRNRRKELPASWSLLLDWLDARSRSKGRSR